MLKRRRIHTSLKLKVKEKTIVTSIRLLPSLKEQIEQLAEQDQRTGNSLMVRILTQYVKELSRDDWKDEKLGERRCSSPGRIIYPSGVAFPYCLAKQVTL
jgi:predicted transcriptional regulator